MLSRLAQREGENLSDQIQHFPDAPQPPPRLYGDLKAQTSASKQHIGDGAVCRLDKAPEARSLGPDNADQAYID